MTEEVESRWRDRLGGAAFAALRAALAGVVEHLDPLLPDCLPILGYGLFTRDRGASDALQPARAGRPAALPAARARATGDLPLWALLSRPLLAFARQYEAEPGPSLAISANILRVLTAMACLPRTSLPWAASPGSRWRWPWACCGSTAW